MHFSQSFFKNLRTRIWFIVTFVSVILMVVVIALSSTVFYDTICMALGYSRTLGRNRDSYYETVAKNKQQAYDRGNEVTEKICEEGFVLLKNEDDALPLAKKSRVSVFGKNSVNFVYGGSGSGGGNFRDAPTLYDSLEKAEFIINDTLKAFYENSGASGSGRIANPAIENNSNSTIGTGETPQSRYTADIKSSYSRFNDAAIIVFSRIGGEGWDLPRLQEGNPEKHYLQLDANEQALIEEVTGAGFKKVIVLLNASTAMEIGELIENDKIDACLSVGGPGFAGITALGRILNGDVSPSGKTVDTWAADFKQNPVYVNFSNNGVGAEAGIPDGAAYVDEEGKDTGYYFVDYEEGIYLGYRYYETRGFTDGEQWYSEQVVFPFGYGLSYTSFSWEVVNVEELLSLSVTEDGKNVPIELQIKVTNTGACAGKDVVELFCDLPAGKLEKSSTVLCGFAKTDLLQPGGEQTLTIEFNPYYIASYDYKDADGDGCFGYEIESGDYSLILKTDAHTPKEGVDPVRLAVDKTVTYGNDPVTGEPVVNRFGDADDELDTVLSRYGWDKTVPTAVNTRALTEELRAALSSTATNNPEKNFETREKGEEVKMNAVELRGLAYDDETWNLFLDSLSFTELKDIYNRGAFRTHGISRVNLPETLASDGPVGFVNFISEASVAGNVAYASEYVLGCTWSVALAEEMGKAVGEESIFGKGDRVPTPYTGWYAPGMNLHRSPFGGRNFEYFSEDPYLTGFMAAAEIKGAQSKGVIPYMKHFALNEQETHRDDNGVATWATEQAIRELYLRPFEIAVKTADAKGVMSSFNRIGTVWTGGDYRLLTEVLRDEWGFLGAVISDFNVNSYMNPKQMIYAGGDLNLTTMKYWMRPSESSAGDVAMLRRAAHNVLYCVVNSNAMNGIYEHTVLRVAMPLWQEVTIIVEALIAVRLGIWGFFEIRALVKKLRARNARAVGETGGNQL